MIVAKKGTMITAKSSIENRWITRNCSFFKRIPSSLRNNTKSKQSDEYTIEGSNNTEEPDIEGTNEPLDNEVEDLEVDQSEDEIEAIQPRRNPPRERIRPPYLRDEIENLIH